MYEEQPKLLFNNIRYYYKAGQNDIMHEDKHQPSHPDDS